MDKIRNFKQGRVLLLISMAHAGLRLTPAVEAGMIPEAKSLPDTGCHILQRYEFASELGQHFGRRVFPLRYRTNLLHLSV